MAYKGVSVIALVVVVAVVALIATAGYKQVDAGHRGVLLEFGGVATMVSQSEGMHIVVPFMQDMVQMPIQIQKYISTADSASKDLQTVTTEITVNYQPNPEAIPKLYKEIGISYESRVIDPAVEEVVKQVTANYNAEELITKRPEVKSLITGAITDRLLAYDIIVREISITDFKFSATFAAAIEAKVEVDQNAQKAEALIIQKEAEAKQKEATAIGDKLARIQIAEGIKQEAILIAEGKALAIEIEAVAEAEALRILAAAIKANPDLLKLKTIEQWSGLLPSTYISDKDAMNMLLSIQTTNP